MGGVRSPFSHLTSPLLSYGSPSDSFPHLRTPDRMSPAPVPPARRALNPFQYFARTGSLSGVLLLISTGVAIGWANSPLAPTYFALLESRFAVGPSGHPLELSLLAWLNDGLMAVFFLLVGLEIKREFLVGELASRRQASLPIAAAIGGMVVPAAIYWSINPGGEASMGWGIPMATDIAFALGILTLLGQGVPIGLKVFLTALAIVDDMGAVIVIALFYSDTPHLLPLALAGATLAGLVTLNLLGVKQVTAYLAGGVLLWLALHETGIHPTIAGVLLALTIPSRTRINAAEFSGRARGLLDEFDRAETGDLLVITSKGQQEAVHALERASEHVQAPLLRLEHGLQPMVQYGIMPLFALANAGVRFGGSGERLVTPVTAGIIAGLLIGKPLGIFLFSWLAVRWRLGELPAGTSWRLLHGVAWLGGIGFTMSLFVAALAFGSTMLIPAKTGILLGSGAAAAVGMLLLRRELSRAR
jgi:NhaA family Na+:H+ antiporter